MTGETYIEGEINYDLMGPDNLKEPNEYVTPDGEEQEAFYGESLEPLDTETFIDPNDYNPDLPDYEFTTAPPQTVEYQGSTATVPYKETSMVASKFSTPTNDAELSKELVSNYGFQYYKYYLPPDCYVSNRESKKNWIFLHWTAGGPNPFVTVNGWMNATRNGTPGRNKVATDYVVGSRHWKGDLGDNQYEGVVVQSYPTNNYAWHLGIGRGPNNLHIRSVGIEICSYGPLNEINGKFYIPGTKIEVSKTEVYRLEWAYRGYKVGQPMQKYSNKQIAKLKALLEYLSVIHNIDISKGIADKIRSYSNRNEGITAAFSMIDVNYVANNPGIWTHANVTGRKIDIAPQREIVDMLLSLTSKKHYV